MGEQQREQDVAAAQRILDDWRSNPHPLTEAIAAALSAARAEEREWCAKVCSDALDRNWHPDTPAVQSQVARELVGILAALRSGGAR